ncbi:MULTISPECIES: divalent-cation tolerance protein CutA [unclassified Beijerinckia]|uniref:divalent-cation tolerance protein CutA n=1 Tax=unclassified Beijerinckia TaxID=2638183 RepID=UPI00147E01C4|nr:MULTISPECIES: divalent-cation tolerance protein CutA [unclassified Beijerinckia]
MEPAFDSGYSIVLTTTSSDDNARLIAERLLSDRLAACVQLARIESLYVWDDKLRDEPEIEIRAKIKTADFADVERAIRMAHIYEVPEIVRIAIAEGNAPYLRWISDVTR